MAIDATAAMVSCRIEDCTMTYAIAQDADRLDESHWRWSVWLDAPENELARVKEVVWKLHPTFVPPVVRIKSRKNGFRLKSSGWGEFQIQAEIHEESGEVRKLRHWLRLADASRRKTSSGSRHFAEHQTGRPAPRKARANLFISYRQSDASLAYTLAEALKQHGSEVCLDVDIPDGADLHRWMREKISESDAVVFLVPNQASMHTSGYEIGVADAAGVNVIPVVSEHPSTAALKTWNLMDRKAISFKEGGDPEILAQRILDVVQTST
jgi:hypothetical protein